MRNEFKYYKQGIEDMICKLAYFEASEGRLILQQGYIIDQGVSDYEFEIENMEEITIGDFRDYCTKYLLAMKDNSIDMSPSEGLLV